MSYYYLASPYSMYPNGLDAAHKDVCRAAGLLLMAGVCVYSPIAHSHPIAVAADIDPLSHSFWLPMQKPMMDAAKGIIVLEMEGVNNSKGVNFEIDYFRQSGKPIIYMTPGSIPMEFVNAADLWP